MVVSLALIMHNNNHIYLPYNMVPIPEVCFENIVLPLYEADSQYEPMEFNELMAEVCIRDIVSSLKHIRNANQWS